MRSTLEQFTEFFVHEFMEELWYLQKVAHGDIPTRTGPDDPWQKIFNVTQALLSLSPISGLPAGLMILKEAVTQTIDVTEKIYQTGKKALDGLDTIQDKYTLLIGNNSSTDLMQTLKQGNVDLEVMRSLAELLARGLSQRYEHALIEILDTAHPEKSTILLAREGARRCFQYLQNKPFLDEKSLHESLLTQRLRLMDSVTLGKIDKSWREQIVDIGKHPLPRWIQNLGKEKLAVKTERIASITKKKKMVTAKADFTAQAFYTRSAWYGDNMTECYESTVKHEKTKWWREEKHDIQYPKYGYAYLEDPKHLPFKQLKKVTPCREFRFLLPSRKARFYQPVTSKEIKDYLESKELKTAKQKRETSPLTFHLFLHQTYQYPKDCQAVCHEDLSGLSMNLEYGNFAGVDFSGAIITGDVTGCCFDHGYLVSTIFRDIRCNADISPPSFENANLAHAQLVKAPLAKANLNQTNLSFANLDQADMTNAKILGTQWYKTRLGNIEQKDLLVEQKKQMEEIQQELKKWQTRMDDKISSIEAELKPMERVITTLEATLKIAKDSEKEALEKQKVELLSLMAQQAGMEWVKQYLQEELEKLRTIPGQAELMAEIQAKIGDILREKTDIHLQLTDLSKNINQLSTEVADLQKASNDHNLRLMTLTRQKSDLRIRLEEKFVQMHTTLKDVQARASRVDTENLQKIGREVHEQWLALKQNPDCKWIDDTEQEASVLDQKIQLLIRQQEKRLSALTYQQQELKELRRFLLLSMQPDKIRQLQVRQRELHRQLLLMQNEKNSQSIDFLFPFSQLVQQRDQLDISLKPLNNRFNEELKALDASHTEKLQRLITGVENLENDLVYRLDQLEQMVDFTRAEKKWAIEVKEIKTDYPKIKPENRHDLDALQSSLFGELEVFLRRQQMQQIQQHQYQQKIVDLQIKVSQQIDASLVEFLRAELKLLKDQLGEIIHMADTNPVSDKLKVLQSTYEKQIEDSKSLPHTHQDTAQKLKKQAENFAGWRKQLEEQKIAQDKMHQVMTVRLQQELMLTEVSIERLLAFGQPPVPFQADDYKKNQNQGVEYTNRPPTTSELQEVTYLREQLRQADIEARKNLLKEFLVDVAHMMNQQASWYLPKNLDELQRLNITRPLVFLSYAWELDGTPKLIHLHDFLTYLAANLTEAGLIPWLDRQRMTGDLEKQMQTNIERSQYVLLIGTDRYAERTKPGSDTNVYKELEFTLKEYKKRSASDDDKSSDFLLPLMLEGDYGKTFPAVGKHLIRDGRSWYSLETGQWQSFDNYVNGLTQCEPLGILPCLLGLNRLERGLLDYRENCRKQYVPKQRALMNELKLLDKRRESLEEKLNRNGFVPLMSVPQMPSRETGNPISTPKVLSPVRADKHPKVGGFSPAFMPPSRKEATPVLPLSPVERPIFVVDEKKLSFGEAIYKKALSDHKQKKYNLAREGYKQALALGVTNAGNKLATLLIRGQGGKKDAAAAVALYTQLAEAGDVLAMENLAKVYEYGDGVPKNKEKADYWWERRQGKKIAPSPKVNARPPVLSTNGMGFLNKDNPSLSPGRIRQSPPLETGKKEVLGLS